MENMEEKLSGMSKSISIEKPRGAESLDAESNSLSQLQKQLANRFVEVKNLEQEIDEKPLVVEEDHELNMPINEGHSNNDKDDKFVTELESKKHLEICNLGT